MKAKVAPLIVLSIMLMGVISSDTFHAYAPAGPDFTITASPTNLGPIQPNMTGIARITVANTNSTLSETVTLTNSTSSSSLSCSLNPTVLAILPSKNANATLSCRSLATGTFTVNVNGTDATSKKHTVTLTYVFKNLVNLDATSSTQLDAVVEPSASQAKTFRVGAVANATTANPINGVAGWQFQITYNASAFIPQADPNPSSTYLDGAGSAVGFGAQSAPGTANWNVLITNNYAFPAITIYPPAGSTGQILVGLAILGTSPTPFYNLSAKTLLANVAFELINKPSTPQTFIISNVVMSDTSASTIPYVTSGAGATETVTNTPPRARFTVSALVKGDASCAPITGSNCSAYAFKFDGTTSSDPEDGTIAKQGFFWDFGDGTQDSVNAGLAGCATGILNCTQGGVAIHDYGMSGQFTVSLRVADSQGATGASRDATGTVISNIQPSHTSLVILAANGFLMTASPTALSMSPAGAGVIGTTVLTLTSVTTGFSGTISLTATTNPSGANAPTTVFNTTTVNLPVGGIAYASLTVSAGALTPRVNYNITVRATIGQVVNNLTIPIIPTTMRVQPALVMGVASGNTFTVNVNTTAALLFGWQFQLNYNQTILQAGLGSVTFGSFWSTASGNGQAILIRIVNQTFGKILLAGTLLAGAQAFTGNGTLVTIKFTVIGTGVTTLALTSNYLINSIGLGQNLAFSQTNGVFCNLSTCLNHDVAVTGITSTPVNPSVGTTVTVSAIISNTGLNPENVTVTFKAGSTTIGTQQILLIPGNSTTVSVQWATNSLSGGSYTITVSTALTGATNQDPNNGSGTANITLSSSSPPPSIPWLYIVIGAVAAAAIASGLFIFLRRRKIPSTQPTVQPGTQPSPGTSPPPGKS